MKLLKTGVVRHIHSVIVDSLPDGLDLTVRLDYAHFYAGVRQAKREEPCPPPEGTIAGSLYFKEPVDVALLFVHDGASWDNDDIAMRCMLGLVGETDQERRLLSEGVMYLRQNGPEAQIVFLDASAFEDVIAPTIDEFPELATGGDSNAFLTVTVKQSPSFLWFEAVGRDPLDWVLPAQGDERFGLIHALAVTATGQKQAAGAVGIPPDLAQRFSPFKLRAFSRTRVQYAFHSLVQRADCERTPILIDKAVAAA